MFHDFLDQIVVFLFEGLHVGPVHGGVGITPWTKVLVDVVGLNLQDSDAVTVKPVGAALTADVEPGNENKWKSFLKWLNTYLFYSSYSTPNLILSIINTCT